MDRRRFLSLFGAAVAGVALEQAVPLGRVWSFPSKIVVPAGDELFRITSVTQSALEVLRENISRGHALAVDRVACFEAGLFEVGDIISIRLPQRFLICEGPFIRELPQAAHPSPS